MNQNNRKGNHIAVHQNEDGMQTQFQQVEEYSYSLSPPPEVLEVLARIDPQLVRDLMATWAVYMTHCQKMEEGDLEELKRVNIANIAYDKRNLRLLERGQWFAVANNFGLLIFAGFALWLGYPVVASSILPVFVAVLVVYVLRKSPHTPPPKE